MCLSVTPLAVKFSFSFLFAVVVCVAAKSACCALFVLPVAVPVAYGVRVTGIAGLIISAVIIIIIIMIIIIYLLSYDTVVILIFRKHSDVT